MVAVEVKYDFTPYDGTPGKPWEDYEDRLLNSACAAKSDDRGWSLADHINGVDEGSAERDDTQPVSRSLGSGRARRSRRSRPTSYNLL